MPGLTRKRVNRSVIVPPEEVEDNQVPQIADISTTTNTNNESGSRESIENDASMIFNQQQSDRSQLSVMSNSNRDNMTRTRARQSSPAADFEDRTASRKKSNKKRELSNSSKTEVPKKKRANRVISDDDEEEDENGVSSSQPFQQPSSIQMSTARSTAPPTQSDDLDTHNNSNEDFEPATFGVPLMNGQVSANQLDARIEEQHAIDAETPISLLGEPGHIKEIHLTNFMCHDNFSITLGKLLLFSIHSFKLTYIVCLFC